MNIIIVGCGRVGSRLATNLAKSGHNVSVIDFKREAFARLNTDFQGATYQGSGLDFELLKRAGATKADIVFALTGGDNRNLTIAQIVKHKFNVQKAVARLHDPVRAAKYSEMGVETLCTTTVMEGLLELYVGHGEFPVLPGDIKVCGDASALNE